MKKALFCLFLSFAVNGLAIASSGILTDASTLPHSVTVIGNANMHVQGIAVSPERQAMYFTFTTQFIKTDMEGHILGTIDGVPGHLGAMTLNPADGKVYASLEYKDDEIGRGIAKSMGMDVYSRSESSYFVAVIDVDKVTREGMTPADGVITLVRVEDAIRDYTDSVTVGGITYEHRYGCSGIDGMAFAPAPGKTKGRQFLYVAYGIYGDTERSDNDHQVLVCYDVSRWDTSTTTAKPRAKYFVYTGNTTYGVQNMAYDADNGTLLLCVYPGKKASYPNYGTYPVDLRHRATRTRLKDVPYEKGKTRQLPLAPLGTADRDTGIYGWHYPWGSTGICPMGNSLFYLSHPFRTADGQSGCTIHLARFTPSSDQPFKELP